MELQLIISYYAGISIDFHPEEEIEFAATAAVFW